MRDSFLASIRAFVLIGARRPFWAVSIGLIATLVGLMLIPGLKISTSRRDLISEDNPRQRKTLSFDEKFGYSNSPVIVLSGGTKEARHRAVDELTRRLEETPELHQRVLGRVDPKDFAEVLFLNDPEAVASALDRVDAEAVRSIDKGIVGWIDAMRASLERGLEGQAATDEETQKGLKGLRTALETFRLELESAGGLSVLTANDAGPVGRGFDAEGYLSGDDEHHIVALFPELLGDEGYQVRPVVQRIRAARDAVKTDDVRVDVTGLPALVTDELGTIERDLAVTSAASTVALILTLFWAFRSFRQAMVSFLPLGFGTLVTFGIVRLALGKLNLITASFTSVLLGLGDFGVHIQTRYSELLRQGHEPKEAMETAMVKSGPGLVVGTITTAMAFLTTIVTDFTAFAELGFITSLGLVVMLAGTYLLVPSAVLLLLGKKPRPSPELPGFRGLAEFVGKRARLIVALSVAFTLAASVGIPKLSFNGRYFDFLPEDSESARGLRELERDGVASPFVANVRANSLDEARVVAEKLRALPSVASVETASDMFPELSEKRLLALGTINEKFSAVTSDALDKRRALPTDKAALKKSLVALRDVFDEVGFAMGQAGKDTTEVERAKVEIQGLIKAIDEVSQPRLDEVEDDALEILARALEGARKVQGQGGYAITDMPALFQHRFASNDRTEVALFVHPKGDIWNVDTARIFTSEIDSVTDQASGIATTLAEHPTMIIDGFKKATGLAAVLVVLILAISFRKVVDVMVAAIPLVLGSLVMLGLMPLLGLQFNHANLVVLPLLLGLGVESGAHIMSRYHQSREERGGKASLVEMLSSTGSAVFVASLTTIWGFSVMMFGEYRAVFGLGLIMTIGMSATLLFSLLTLPAVLKLLGRAE